MSLEIVQIIEDEPLHARLLDHSLRQARYRTNVAVDGVTGLADVKRLSPAVILLDLTFTQRTSALATGPNPYQENYGNLIRFQLQWNY